MKEFSKYIKKINASLTFLENNSNEFKNVKDNLEIIDKLENNIRLYKKQSLENTELVAKAINEIDKILSKK
tara:strand:+ start:258 stop:470 length:213 start_codon:yes stop_codon:yes gene_type:complete